MELTMTGDAALVRALPSLCALAGADCLRRWPALEHVSLLVVDRTAFVAASNHRRIVVLSLPARADEFETWDLVLDRHDLAQLLGDEPIDNYAATFGISFLPGERTATVRLGARTGTVRIRNWQDYALSLPLAASDETQALPDLNGAAPDENINTISDDVADQDSDATEPSRPRQTRWSYPGYLDGLSRLLSGPLGPATTNLRPDDIDLVIELMGRGEPVRLFSPTQPGLYWADLEADPDQLVDFHVVRPAARSAPILYVGSDRLLYWEGASAPDSSPPVGPWLQRLSG